MSRALPGTERKRISENAPMTATPVPMLPLTIMMTVATIIGSRISETTKLLLAWERTREAAAHSRPQPSAAARQRRKDSISSVLPRMESKISMSVVAPFLLGDRQSAAAAAACSETYRGGMRPCVMQ